MHELRRGEMADCREIPFIPYYGSVDATPLFLMLLAEYCAGPATSRARPRAVAGRRARAGVDAGRRRRSDRGYSTYLRRSSRGLVNQGWKDSLDAIMHADGRLAEAPIALAEVQGYLYAALLAAADIAEAAGAPERRRAPARAGPVGCANGSRRDFWLADEAYYAMALDGEGAPCRVITSNAGHLLWTGIVSDGRAQIVARRMMDDDMYTGWGIRTLGSGERLYNPMSYHNGSVWPHDTAIAAVGMRRYGLRASRP